MTAFRFTLITDGSSDKILLPVLSWLLKTWLPDVSLQERWVDFGSLPNRPITLEGQWCFGAGQLSWYRCERSSALAK